MNINTKKLIVATLISLQSIFMLAPGQSSASKTPDTPDSEVAGLTASIDSPVSAGSDESLTMPVAPPNSPVFSPVMYHVPDNSPASSPITEVPYNSPVSSPVTEAPYSSPIDMNHHDLMSALAVIEKYNHLGLLPNQEYRQAEHFIHNYMQKLLSQSLDNIATAAIVLKQVYKDKAEDVQRKIHLVIEDLSQVLESYFR